MPKTTSNAADAGAPSFLTTLPPEIRVMVYEILLWRDGPVLVHNVRAYYAQRPTGPERETDCEESDRGADVNEVNYDVTHETEEIEIPEDQEDHDRGASRPHNNYRSRYKQYQTRLRKWFNQLESEQESLAEFDHDFSAGFALFKTCQQTYHGVADTLYRKNAFKISRVLSRHDHLGRTENSLTTSSTIPPCLVTLAQHIAQFTKNSFHQYICRVRLRLQALDLHVQRISYSPHSLGLFSCALQHHFHKNQPHSDFSLS